MGAGLQDVGGASSLVQNISSAPPIELRISLRRRIILTMRVIGTNDIRGVGLRGEYRVLGDWMIFQRRENSNVPKESVDRYGKASFGKNLRSFSVERPGNNSKREAVLRDHDDQRR